jgi:hypothetical protein
LIEALGAFLHSGLINRSGKVGMGKPGAQDSTGHLEILMVHAEEQLGEERSLFASATLKILSVIKQLFMPAHAYFSLTAA